jgi:carboxypeptidase family protein
MQLSYSARAFVRSFLKHISWLLFTIGITSIVCMAQIDRAALTGTVTDPTGAMVQHAEVQAVDLATGLKSEAQTNSKGVYLLPGLAVGTYAVTISHQGFGTVGFQNVLLEVGLTRVLNVTLRVSVPGEKIHANTYHGSVYERLRSHAQTGNNPQRKARRGDGSGYFTKPGVSTSLRRFFAGGQGF